MIVRLAQRYASFLSIMAAILAMRVLLPEGAPFWQDLAIGLPITLGIYLLLYKDGVTANRPKKPSKERF